MRLLFLIVTIAGCVSLFSCTDSEEPRSPILGAWENRSYVDSIDYWMVETYDFVNDSTYDITVTVRETETGPDLGYRLITRGWYNLEADKFSFYYSDALIIDGYGEDASEIKYYVPKEELRPIIIDLFRVPTATLTFSADRMKFEITEECEEYYPTCPLSETFVKVN